MILVCLLEDCLELAACKIPCDSDCGQLGASLIIFQSNLSRAYSFKSVRSGMGCWEGLSNLGIRHITGCLSGHVTRNLTGKGGTQNFPQKVTSEHQKVGNHFEKKKRERESRQTYMLGHAA